MNMTMPDPDPHAKSNDTGQHRWIGRFYLVIIEDAWPYFYWGLLGCFAFVCMITYIQVSQMGHDDRSQLSALVYGTAYKPCVTRALLPILIRLTYHNDKLSDILIQESIKHYGGAIRGLSPDNPSLAIIAIFWLFIFLIIFLVSLRYLMAGLGYSRFWTAVSPFLIMPAIVILFLPGAYVYDLVTLAMFTLCLAFLQARKWDLFLYALALASIAKETAVILILVYLVVEWRDWDYRFIVEQVAVVFMTRSYLWFVYMNNPGLELNYKDVFWTNWALVYLPLVVLGLWLAIRSFSSKPPPLFLRRSIAAAFPAFLLLCVIFGYPGEYRDFMEIFPIIFLVLIPSPVKPIEVIL